MPTIYKEKKGRSLSWTLPKREADTSQSPDLYTFIRKQKPDLSQAWLYTNEMIYGMHDIYKEIESYHHDRTLLNRFYLLWLFIINKENRAALSQRGST